MATAATTSTERPKALGARTLCEALIATAGERGGQTALRTPQDTPSLTYAEAMERVEALAAGLYGLGVRRGDAVGLMLTNRPGFHMFDAAAMMLGACPFSVYNTNPAEAIAYVTGDAGNDVMITERRFVDVIREAGTAKTIVSLDGGGDLGIGDLVAKA